MGEIHVRHDDVGRFFIYPPRLVPLDQKPPAQGAPVTERLSFPAARKIKGAALKAHDLGMGLRCFMTLTLGPGARAEIASGGLRLSGEMRRFLNGLRARLRRRGVSDDVVFIWVAENPGDSNPHVHLLTNLTVPRSEFRVFAASMESLWGHGYVHIERIRNAQAAGDYMLKAVGYTSKGAAGSQGTVYGRRYGVSRAIQPTEERDALDVRLEIQEGLEMLMAIAAGKPEGEQYIPLRVGVTVTPYGISMAPRHTNADLLNVLDQVPELAEAMRPKMQWDEVPFM